MLTTSFVYSAAALVGLTAAYAIPSSDGFPTPSAQQLLDIETEAGGLLSNAPPPPALSDTGITNFQLIAFNEFFEVAFFSSLIYNITNKVPGFESAPGLQDTGALLEILQAVKAQEELHALTAVKNLQHFNAKLIPSPCQYTFPTTDLESAISLAATFTSLVLGTLADAEKAFTDAGDKGAVVRAVASVIGQEGEQNGFYRILLGEVPSEKPFLTTNTGAFAFSALQQFIVSCPFDITQIPIPIFPTINVLTTATPKDSTLEFEAVLSKDDVEKYAKITSWRDGQYQTDGLFVTYLTGQQVPISVPVGNVMWYKNVLKFDAVFPFTENIMDGLSIAALTNSSNFADADDVPANTLAAPGLIQVNKLLGTKPSW